MQVDLLHASEKEQAGLTTEEQMLLANHQKQIDLIQETNALFLQWIEESRDMER